MTSIYDQVDATSLTALPDDRPPAKKRAAKREALNTTQVREGKRKLSELVDAAFNTLEQAMELADYATAVRAATVILDRTGFGPKSTMDVNTTHIDLSSLSKEQLAARASKVAEMIRGVRNAEIVPPGTSLAVIPSVVVGDQTNA